MKDEYLLVYKLEYRGFTGSVEFSIEDEVYHGKILGVEDLVTYETNSIEGLEKSFRKSVNEYTETRNSLEKASTFDFSFAESLDIELKHFMGTFDSLHYVRRVLIGDYCFKPFKLDNNPLGIVLVFPKGYNIVHKEWVTEVIRYHCPLGIFVEVREQC